MSRIRFSATLAGLAALCLFAPRSPSQVRERPASPAPTAPPPRMVPVAETRLLMEGMTKPNFDGLARTFKQKPADAEGWAFARGQALLVAESANLLLIRPPRTRQAQDAWAPRAVEMREAGVKLARAAGARDYVAARAGLANLANACNRCHEAFRVPVRISPDAAE
jgi:cytochrome c556